MLGPTRLIEEGSREEQSRQIADLEVRRMYIDSLNDALFLLLAKRLGGDRERAWQLYCDFATNQDPVAIGKIADIIVSSST